MNKKDKLSKLPELLSPAGSPKALEAVIEAGADAVYLGASGFNARIGAANFSPEELLYATELAHIHGVKVYQTLNTLFYDREAKDFLKAAEDAYTVGVDALIVADMGGASMIKRYIGDFPLHASTQASIHNLSGADILQNAGFSRVVLAREMPLADIKYFTQNSPLEAEIFVHGALCVSYSGQCLFSSLVGGRSGNRGECAQPCRLPYNVNKKEGYPLSLKDFCLAGHINELISVGVSSLKIEGRMKSPEYVYNTTKIYRRLLDENRNATDDEIEYLAEIFSRGGFTDGYFTGKIGSHMLGVRSFEDKKNSRQIESFDKIQKKIPIYMEAEFTENKPSKLSVKHFEKTVTVYGDVPEKALNSPITQETIERNLSKLGSTPFYANSVQININGSLMLPISSINKLRRQATEILLKTSRNYIYQNYTQKTLYSKKENIRTARFYKEEQITNRAKDYFDIRYLPLYEFKEGSHANGVIIPPVVFDHEREKIAKMLNEVCGFGVGHILCGNLGHISFVGGYSVVLHGDFRLNVTNSEASVFMHDNGFDNIILSPELTLPQSRDISGNTALIVYGRVPLMTLEKCVSKEISSCDMCMGSRVEIKDRKGIKFPVLREWEHRNVIYNSVPIYMGDVQNRINDIGIYNRHFIFSTETGKQIDTVIEAYEKGYPPQKALGTDKIRRI